MYYIRLLSISETVVVFRETYKVFDDPHELWTEKVELETGIDD
jgi:hypothetical protein